MASASTKSTGRSFGALCRARSSIGPDMSTPSTWPDGATSRANAIAVAPLPQPTSMTRSPGFSFARSITRSATGPSTMSCAACRSRPALAGGTVPVGDLVGVLIVACGGVHAATIVGEFQNGGALWTCFESQRCSPPPSARCASSARQRLAPSSRRNRLPAAEIPLVKVVLPIIISFKHDGRLRKLTSLEFLKGKQCRFSKNTKKYSEKIGITWTR